MSELPAAHIDSHHAATLGEAPRHAPLREALRVEVAIVGGGLTGVATALGLAERGVSVALLEARRIGWGASGRNGGQVSGSLSGDTAMLRQLSRRVGRDEAGVEEEPSGPGTAAPAAADTAATRPRGGRDGIASAQPRALKTEADPTDAS